jgi:hypothetical protein
MYSRETQTQFIKSKLCQDDPKLFDLFARATSPGATELQRRAFRKKLGKADVTDAVQTFMTDECRPLIYGAVKTMNAYMKPMGDMVISGGDAFNHYFPKDVRIVTTDIDTKFCPIFMRKLPDGTRELISSRTQGFFEALQITKVLMWDRLGKLCQQLNGRITARLRRFARSPVGRLLQVVPVARPLRRRYTLIPKKKHGSGDQVKEGDVLIDVELFAIDCKIRFLGKLHNVAGMLDIAYMRPSEIGYDVVYSRQKTKDGLLVAGKKFLMEDLYMMQALNLRPAKAEKDRLRMFMFATKVLGVPVKKSDSIRSMYLKTIDRVRDTRSLMDRKVFDRSALLKKALAVDVNRYPRTPSFSKLGKCVSNAPRKGFAQTKSTFAYGVVREKWVTVDSEMYIRNQAKYRGNAAKNSSWGTPVSSPCKRTAGALYGYNPVRNAQVPRKLIQKAAAI